MPADVWWRGCCDYIRCCNLYISSRSTSRTSNTMSYECHMSPSYNLVRLLRTERWSRRIMNKQNMTKCADQCHASRDWCDRRDICETSCKTISSQVSVSEVAKYKCNQCEFVYSKTDKSRNHIWRHKAEKGENMVVHLSLIVLSTGFIEQHRHHEKNSSLLMECHLSSVVSQVSSARGQKRLKEVDDEQICHFII